MRRTSFAMHRVRCWSCADDHLLGSLLRGRRLQLPRYIPMYRGFFCLATFPGVRLVYRARSCIASGQAVHGQWVHAGSSTSLRIHLDRLGIGPMGFSRTGIEPDGASCRPPVTRSSQAAARLVVPVFDRPAWHRQSRRGSWRRLRRRSPCSRRGICAAGRWFSMPVGEWRRLVFLPHISHRGNCGSRNAPSP